MELENYIIYLRVKIDQDGNDKMEIRERIAIKILNGTWRNKDMNENTRLYNTVILSIV